jgi:acylphosphatase
MVKKRATIIISGDVQDVGFRAVVMRMGQKAGLVGYVENLPNGTVRAICEGEEKAIKEFINKLDKHHDDIVVENIEVKWSKSQGKFKYFEVKVTNLGNELFQGFATAGRKLSTMHTDLKGGFDRVEGAIGSMHKDMNVRFDTLDQKYGAISHQMNAVTIELQKTTAALVSMTEKVGAIIDKKLAE